MIDLEKLQELKSLKDSGVITEEEFEILKREELSKHISVQEASSPDAKTGQKDERVEQPIAKPQRKQDVSLLDKKDKKGKNKIILILLGTILLLAIGVSVVYTVQKMDEADKIAQQAVEKVAAEKVAAEKAAAEKAAVEKAAAEKAAVEKAAAEKAAIEKAAAEKAAAKTKIAPEKLTLADIAAGRGVLKKGDKGKLVKNLQKFFRKDVNGVFDASLEESLRNYQYGVGISYKEGYSFGSGKATPGVLEKTTAKLFLDLLKTQPEYYDSRLQYYK
jgi:hypothetical protein